jgi:diguanylate cyclase (GGDEF)-like protein/PAS domain S-box-containing protein
MLDRQLGRQIRLLFGVLLLTVCLIGWFSWSLYRISAFSSDSARVRGTNDSLHLRALELDGGLSRATKMYVATGSPEWAEERRSLARGVEAVIGRVSGALPEPRDNTALDRVWRAHDARGAVEKRAIRLADDGSTTDAQASLGDQAYPNSREAFRKALETLMRPLEMRYRAVLAARARSIREATVGGVGALVLSVVAWAFVIGNLSRWRRSVLRSIRERIRVEAALSESEQRYALAVRGANDGIWDWDLRSGRVHFSSRWKTMLGFMDDEVGDLPEEWLGRIHPDDQSRTRKSIKTHLSGKVPLFESEHRIADRSGNWRWMLARGIAVRDRDGAPTRMAGSQTDITRRKAAEEQLRHGAFHDALTDLPNRHYFDSMLNRACARLKRHPDRLLAVLFLDLDDFKAINDSLGHAAGDRFLVATARRLLNCLRPGDTAARLGGDEFVVLLEDLESPADASEIANRIMQELAAPVAIANTEVSASVSVGFVTSDCGVTEPAKLVALADAAMYRVKSEGRPPA